MVDKNDMLMEESGNDNSHLGKLFTMGNIKNWNKCLEANQNDSWQAFRLLRVSWYICTHTEVSEIHLVHNNKNLVILKKISYSGDLA